ncbi:TetR/AcrR family transcriptional regulator [Cohnella thailandensis]|uniref:TetR/AcrR family transcriptional regulator n=1 Tax=Cohnella thailandensis TaxID=557557 RepID=A0A841SY45_9BACL|nr:TetR/AcrR family transcriptional regulator [Cohnella thailandensis]MBB6633671.1 TetR/AcrR family transcriptional regulator [Cohnella thailandensis]MBP1976456.1 AcrR family transcriptional regulator [Cohnella thailandensis]
MNREDKKILTRQRIMESAVQLFEERGFMSTSVQMITDRAEVAKGTFFNYFASKEDMILALQSDTLISVIGSKVEPEGPVLPSLYDGIVAYAKEYPMFKSTTRAVLQGMFGSPKIGDVQRKRSEKFIEFLTPILERGQNNGEIASDRSAKQIAAIAVEAYYGVLMLWSLDLDEVPLLERMKSIYSVFIDGIRAGTRSPDSPLVTDSIS